MNRHNYTGPRIPFDMGSSSAIIVKPISEEVARWKQESGAPGNAQSDEFWKSFQEHDSAPSFSFAKFLVRLRETSEYKSARLQPDFQQRIGRLLTQLEQADSTTLREVCFTQAAEAVDTCGDRVALSLLNMETACATYQAEVKARNGGYDHQLQELVDLGKGMYRLQQLGGISQAKVKTLNFVDEIEVHLGYLVHFSKEFKLPVQMQTMLYPDCFAITQADVTAARNALKGHAEEGDNHNRALLDFLASWSPMDMMMKKRDPDAFAAMDIKIKTEIKQAHETLQTRLDELDKNAADYEQKAKLLMAENKQIPATIAAAQEKRQLVADLLSEQNVKARLQ